MNPADYLVLARVLATDGDLDPVDNEAKFRTSISRAYYAVYLEVRTQHFASESNVRHRHVIQRVMKQAGVETAIKLRNLYRMRERADYRMLEPISDDDAQESIRIAVELIEAIQ